MANSILAQSRISNELFYEYEYAGNFLKHIDWKSGDFKPSANVGGTYTYRRPGKTQTFSTALSSQGTVPTVGSAPSYGVYTEPKFPLVATRKFRQAVVISSQDMSIGVTTEQVLERMKSRIVVLRHQIERYAIGLTLAGSSAVIGTPGTASTGDTLLDNFNKAGALITSRGVVDSGKRIALVPNIQVAPNVLKAYRGLYNPQAEVSAAFKGGVGAMGRFGNLNFMESPFIPSDAVSVVGTGVTLSVTGAYQNAGAVWTQTWNLIVTGTAGLVIPAGTLFKLSNSGTEITWVTADVFTDTGITAVFRTTTDVTLNGSTGVGTLTVTEPLIADTTDGTISTNGYQNVSANPANSGTATILNDVASAYPSIVFDPKAIAGVSVPVKMGRSIYTTVQEIDGVNLTLIETTDPFNGSTIYEIQAIVGFAVGLPEAIVSVY